METCKSCGRPLPGEHRGKKCEACRADQRARMAKVLSLVGAAASFVIAILLGKKR